MAAEVTEETVRDLHAKIGEVAVANDLYELDSVNGVRVFNRPPITVAVLVFMGGLIGSCWACDPGHFNLYLAAP